MILTISFTWDTAALSPLDCTWAPLSLLLCSVCITKTIGCRALVYILIPPATFRLMSYVFATVHRWLERRVLDCSTDDFSVLSVFPDLLKLNVRDALVAGSWPTLLSSNMTGLEYL